MNGAALQGGCQTRRRRGRARAERSERSERAERERPERSERCERVERFAASKWGAAPAACALPPPPTHWRPERCERVDRALPLKLLLNVSASA